MSARELKAGDRVRWASDERCLAGGVLRATFEHAGVLWAAVAWGGPHPSLARLDALAKWNRAE